MQEVTSGEMGVRIRICITVPYSTDRLIYGTTQCLLIRYARHHLAKCSLLMFGPSQRSVQQNLSSVGSGHGEDQHNHKSDPRS